MGGFADSTVLKKHGHNMVSGDFTPGAHASVQLKDMNTIMAQATSLGLQLEVTPIVRSLYEEMCSNGKSDLDHSALYLELNDKQSG